MTTELDPTTPVAKVNRHMADVWSLGIVLLELCTLEKVKSGYEFEPERIKKLIVQTKLIYGSKIGSIIENMLKPLPRDRWTFS